MKNVKATLVREGDSIVFGYEIPEFDYTMEQFEEFRKRYNCSDELACRSALTKVASMLARMLLQYGEDIERGKVKISFPE